MPEDPKPPLWIRLSEFAANYRVRISAGVLVLVLVQNLLLSNLPRNIPGLMEPLGIAAVALVLAGLAVRSWAAGTLRKGQALTTWGPYQLCRHPLYLGSILVVGGFVLMLPTVLNVLLMLLFLGATYGLTIVREERRLAIKYGAAWKDYVATTPRLLPVGASARVAAEWSFAQWYRSREHRALLVTPLALAALELWHTLS